MTTLISDLDTRAQSRVRVAETALLLATLIWGASFTWAKEGGDAVNSLAGAADHALLGPMFLMGVRFLGAGLIWLTVFPQARRGWTRQSVGRGIVLGLLMTGGTALQMLGLDRTSEAVSAFLTSLTILWVPTIMTLGMRRPPPGVFWFGVVLAGAGIWLMTGAMPRGLGVGEILGFSCSIVYSFMIIAVNVLVARDDPWRMTAAQLVVTGLSGLALCAFSAPGRHVLWPATAGHILAQPLVWQNLALLILLPTIGSFGIMMFFQPRIDPSRAALIYLLEPVFAAAYAWIAIGRKLGLMELLGAGLILAANLLVEALSLKGRKSGPQPG